MRSSSSRLERAAQTGAAFVHPFDDLDVIAGQGTLGLELLEDVPDLARVIVPVGGGGLAAASASPCAGPRAAVELIGVQARRLRSLPRRPRPAAHGDASPWPPRSPTASPSSGPATLTLPLLGALAARC